MERLRLLALAGALFVSMVTAPAAQAVNVFDQCDSNPESEVCKAANDPGEQNATSLVKTIINMMLYVLGIVAVIMLIHGGLKYVTSRGDPANIKSAKDTVLYAVIGVIVALFAYAIVNFVVVNLG